MNTTAFDGITIHEVLNSVVVLVATASSVHRLSFPHPDSIHNQVVICYNTLKHFSFKLFFKFYNFIGACVSKTWN